MKLTDKDRFSRYAEIEEVDKLNDKFSKSMKIKLAKMNDLYRNSMELTPTDINATITLGDSIISELAVMHDEIKDYISNRVQKKLVDSLLEINQSRSSNSLIDVHITYTKDMSFNQCVAHTLRFINEALKIPVGDRISTNQLDEVLLIEGITLGKTQRVLLENSGFIDTIKYIHKGE